MMAVLELLGSVRKHVGCGLLSSLVMLPVKVLNSMMMDSLAHRQTERMLRGMAVVVVEVLVVVHSKEVGMMVHMFVDS